MSTDATTTIEKLKGRAKAKAGELLAESQKARGTVSTPSSRRDRDDSLDRGTRSQS